MPESDAEESGMWISKEGPFNQLCECIIGAIIDKWRGLIGSFPNCFINLDKINLFWHGRQLRWLEPPPVRSRYHPYIYITPYRFTKLSHFLSFLHLVHHYWVANTIVANTMMIGVSFLIKSQVFFPISNEERKGVTLEFARGIAAEARIASDFCSQLKT